MRLNVILHERSWILEKIATVIDQCSITKDIETSISYQNHLPGYDVYFHIWYLYAKPVHGSRNIIYVTHIDADWKLKKLDELIANGIDGIICLSKQMKTYLQERYPYLKIECFIPGSAMTSKELRKETFKISYISRVYSDKRKNEHWISELIHTYNQQDISFLFIGSGWKALVFLLCQKGYEATWIPEYNPQLIARQLSNIDLCIYLGFDEGSISVIDYLSQRKKCLVSDQGFHRELADATPDLIKLFKTQKEFETLLDKEIKNIRQWRITIDQLQWSIYGEKIISELLSY